MIYIKRRVGEESKKHLLHRAKKMEKFTKELVDMLEDCIEDDDEDDEDDDIDYRNEGHEIRHRRGRR